MKKIILGVLLSLAVQAKTIPIKISAYTSSKSQTQGNPFVAAWGDRLKKYHKKRVIAVSRDLLKHVKHNQKVKIKIGKKIYNVKVVDKMAKRWHRKVDLYFYTSRKEALRFGVKRGKLII